MRTMLQVPTQVDAGKKALIDSCLQLLAGRNQEKCEVLGSTSYIFFFANTLLSSSLTLKLPPSLLERFNMALVRPIIGLRFKPERAHLPLVNELASASETHNQGASAVARATWQQAGPGLPGAYPQASVECLPSWQRTQLLKVRRDGCVPPHTALRHALGVAFSHW